MRIYTNNTFTGHWPTGAAAVVRAKNKVEAAEKLNEALIAEGLPGDVDDFNMVQFNKSDKYNQGDVRILHNGEY